MYMYACTRTQVIPAGITAFSGCTERASRAVVLHHPLLEGNQQCQYCAFSTLQGSGEFWGALIPLQHVAAIPLGASKPFAGGKAKFLETVH